MRRLLAVGILLLAGCGGHAVRAITDPHAAVLRAGDLPRGYREGDDTVCGLATTEEGSAELAALFAEERPHGCIIELNRVWGTAPRFRTAVTSAAYVFRNDAGARRGFDTRSPLLPYTASVTIASTTPFKLGNEAVLVRGRGLNSPAVAVVWRSGNVLAILAVEPANEQIARTLAARQQLRIEGHLPTAPPADTVELQLDDPSLHLPVYWLGRTFTASSLPQLGLVSADVLTNGPGDTVKLDYGGASGGLTLDLWTPAAWTRFSHTLLGRLIWDSPCARKTTVRLTNGHAEIFEGYGTSSPLATPCPSRPADRVIAHVYLPGVVVAIDMPYCYTCAESGPTRSPYETVPTMTTLARALELRR
jgi:hypothetical protein